jgi:NTE family protein
LKDEPRPDGRKAMPKTGIVFSGGSSKGAFSVGVLETLRGQGITLDIVSGTSTGALIAPLVITDEIQILNHFYSNVDTSDIVVPEPSPGHVFSTDPLRRLIDSVITQDRFDQIMDSDKTMFLATLNLPSGEIMYWSNKPPDQDLADSGVHLIPDRETMCAAMLASCSQPVLTPVVEVPSGGDVQVDGGIREVTPLKILIDAGVERIFAVVVNPDHEGRQEGHYNSMISAGLRTLDLYHREVLQNDIDRAKTYNKAVRYLRDAKKRASDLGLNSTQIHHIFDPAKNPFDDKVAVDLVIIRPEKKLPAKNMKFNHKDMRKMIKLGHVMAKRALSQAESDPDPVPVMDG